MPQMKNTGRNANRSGKFHDFLRQEAHDLQLWDGRNAGV